MPRLGLQVSAIVMAMSALLGIERHVRHTRDVQFLAEMDSTWGRV
jgi:hypothetical protein